MGSGREKLKTANCLFAYILIQLLKNTKPHIIAITGVRTSLSTPSLPAMVPNFTGRQSECEEIIGHVTSESTRLVSIWGSPGFGKTSVAIAVGHYLQSQGLPVCWVSLRGRKSKADLTSKLLSFVTPSFLNDQPSFSQLSLDDQLCLLLSEISDQSVFILDNADDLLEDGEPGVKKEVIGLLKEILRRSKAITFVVTTRESLDFLNVDLQGHQSVRIRPLDEVSATRLVKAVLPAAKSSDCTRILQICGLVPFAIKLMCSSISEDNAQPSQYLDQFMKSASTTSITEMLDRPDYPDEYRLQSFFELSFKRLNAQEKEALVSLSILPENFGSEVAAAVLDVNNLQSKKLLQTLQRKSLLDSGVKKELFTMHKLLQSFAREKGENEMMNDTIRKSKYRLNTFYVSLFEKLNVEYLTGHSMTSFLTFYEDELIIIQSLLEALSDPRTASTVIDVLVHGELFLANLYFSDASSFNFIYDSALKAAKKLEANESYQQLLVSKAFGEACWGAEGSTVQLLSKASLSSDSVADLQGKRLCYLALNHLARGKTEDGVQHLRKALELMHGSLDETILRLAALQILAIFFKFQDNLSDLKQSLCDAQMECKYAKDTELHVIPSTNFIGSDTSNAEENQRDSDNHSDQPLKLQILFIVSVATENFIDIDTNKHLRSTLHQMLKEIEGDKRVSTGLFSVYSNVVSVLELNEDTTVQNEERISFHQKALERCSEKSASYRVHKEALATCYENLGRVLYGKKFYSEALNSQQRALDISMELLRDREHHTNTADRSLKLGVTHHSNGDCKSTLKSKKRTLDIRIERFGKEHARTANSYGSLGVTQHSLGEYTSALDSKQHALDIRLKLFGEEHACTADSYYSLGTTQHSLGDFNAALDSVQHALDIYRKLFGEEHACTANSYYSLGVTQHSLGDFNTALDSSQHALDKRLKLFGEDHADTADSYDSVGAIQQVLGDFNAALYCTQHALDILLRLFGEEHSSIANSYENLSAIQVSLGDFNAALDSQQRALDIFLKLFGEEHASTVNGCDTLGAIHLSLGDYKSALNSIQRSLDIGLKLFGEEHANTADSYYCLGVTQFSLGDYKSAFVSHQHALDIRHKLHGEIHASTAESYCRLGGTQHSLGDYKSALNSIQRSLNIRLKLFGEEHASTADSYYCLGITQHSLGNYKLALDSQQRALDICLTLFGEKHAETAESYHNLGVTQHSFGDYKSALDSKQHALDIRLKSLFGEEHPRTADSYDSLAVTQHSLGDYKSALDSNERALDTRLKLFGEEHASTAVSYYGIGVTQLSIGDLKSALYSHQRALDIRLKLFGEEHESTGDSYHNLGVTQHSLSDFKSALDSNQRALDIRLKLFGEEHASSALSYYSIGVTQHSLGDYKSALASQQRALNIRLKLFGEEHASTADSYYGLGVIQDSLGDIKSALQSDLRSRHIRFKLGEENTQPQKEF